MGFVCPSAALPNTEVDYPYEGSTQYLVGDGARGYRNSWCPGASTSINDDIILSVTDNCLFQKTVAFHMGKLVSSCAAQNCDVFNCGSFCSAPYCFDNSFCTQIGVGTLDVTDQAQTIVTNLDTSEESASAYYNLFRQYQSPPLPCPHGSKRGIALPRDQYPEYWFLEAGEVNVTRGQIVWFNGTDGGIPTDIVYRNSTVVVSWAGFDRAHRTPGLQLALMQPGKSQYIMLLPDAAASGQVRIFAGRTMVYGGPRNNYFVVKTADDSPSRMVAVSRTFELREW